MSPAEIQQSNEDAQAVAEHSARVHRAVDELLATVARWALAVVGGGVLGLHLINVLGEVL